MLTAQEQQPSMKAGPPRYETETLAAAAFVCTLVCLGFEISFWLPGPPYSTLSRLRNEELSWEKKALGTDSAACPTTVSVV